jgi:hypothetical protein
LHRIFCTHRFSGPFCLRFAKPPLDDRNQASLFPFNTALYPASQLFERRTHRL